MIDVNVFPIDFSLGVKFLYFLDRLDGRFKTKAFDENCITDKLQQTKERECRFIFHKTTDGYLSHIIVD